MLQQTYNIVYLFTGQGSQYRAMGRQLYEQHAVFRNSLRTYDGIVQRQLHRSLIHELYHISTPAFTELLITHPAIVAVELAMCQVLQEMGIQPAYVSGNSLGAFAAAAACGVWDAATALEAAIEQAKTIVRYNVPEGGMLAVMHARNKALEQLYQQHGLLLAADNFAEHFTLTGTVQQVAAFRLVLDEKDIPYLQLPVTIPFHSPLIACARPGFDQFMEAIPALPAPVAGFISGIDGALLPVLQKDHFWEAVSQYTNFQQVITCAEGKGPCLYIDLGPSGTAATFVKYNLPASSSSKALSVMSPYKTEQRQLQLLKGLLTGSEKTI